MSELVVGVLALQGSFREHLSHFDALFDQLSKDNSNYRGYKLSTRAVRVQSDLDGINAIVLVGGESTTMSILLQRTGLIEPLSKLVQSGKIAVWGTCAGLILISQVVSNTKPTLGDLQYRLVGGLNVAIKRNSFGRQLDSFTQELSFSGFTDGMIDHYNCVFIRAPAVEYILDDPSAESKSGPDTVVAPVLKRNMSKVEILSTVRRGDKDLIVAVRQGNVLGTSFHPELVDDLRFHKWFVDAFVIGAEKGI